MRHPFLMICKETFTIPVDISRLRVRASRRVISYFCLMPFMFEQSCGLSSFGLYVPTNILQDSGRCRRASMKLSFSSELPHLFGLYGPKQHVIRFRADASEVPVGEIVIVIRASGVRTTKKDDRVTPQPRLDQLARSCMHIYA
jgi:hypothetical protein